MTIAATHQGLKCQLTSVGRSVLAWLVITIMASTLSVAQEQPLREAFPNDDFIVQEVMVPMRDGVKLYTLIITPKQDTGDLPVILKRTPYDASGAVTGRATSRLDINMGSEFLGDD
jgi:predicted acyl esterase